MKHGSMTDRLRFSALASSFFRITPARCVVGCCFRLSFSLVFLGCSPTEDSPTIEGMNDSHGDSRNGLKLVLRWIGFIRRPEVMA